MKRLKITPELEKKWEKEWQQDNSTREREFWYKFAHKGLFIFNTLNAPDLAVQWNEYCRLKLRPKFENQGKNHGIEYSDIKIEELLKREGIKWGQKKAKATNNVLERDGLLRFVEILEKDLFAISQRQVALLYYYQDLTITTENRDRIAREFKFNSPNSGHKLYQHFTEIQKPLERFYKGTKYSNIKRVKDIESIIPFLNGRQKEKANEELKQLRS